MQIFKLVAYRFSFSLLIVDVKGGGGLYSALTNSRMKIADSTFTGNMAFSYGGAIYFGEQHEDTLLVLNTVIKYNSAFRAGGENSKYS